MINEEIRDREVRLISADGEQLGVMPTRQALEMAEQAGLLDYLKKTDIESYRSLIAQLGLRK